MPRSAIPVVTALLAVAIEKKVPTRTEGVALMVLVSGVMVAVWEGAAGSLRGILVCIAGELSSFCFPSSKLHGDKFLPFLSRDPSCRAFINPDLASWQEGCARSASQRVIWSSTAGRCVQCLDLTSFL